MTVQIRTEVKKAIQPYLLNLQRIDSINFSELQNYEIPFIKELEEKLNLLDSILIELQNYVTIIKR